MKKNKKDNKKWINIIILILACFIASIPSFKTYIQSGHDTLFHVTRIEGLAENIKNGDWLSYINYGVLNGYGYGVGLFYSNVMLYLPAILNVIGFSINCVYNMFTFLINVITALAMYWTIKQISKNENNALIGSLVYLFVPYRLCDVYDRAAIGESLAFIFWPILILALYKLYYKNEKAAKCLVISMTGLLLSHIISFIIALMIFFIVFFINIKTVIKNKQIIIEILKAGIISVLLSAFFIFPLLEQYLSLDLNVKYSIYDISEQALKIQNVFQISDNLRNEKVYVPAGIGFLLLAFQLHVFVSYKKWGGIGKLLLKGILFSDIAIICCTDLIPWDILENFAIWLQFPWRLYMIPTVILPMCFAAYFGVNKLNKHEAIYIILLLGIVYVLPIMGCNEKLEKRHFTQAIGVGKEYLTVNFNEEVFNNNKIVSNENITIKYERINNSYFIRYVNKGDKEDHLDIPLTYYKGYRAFINEGKNVRLEEYNGIIRIYLQPGEGSLTVKYENTAIQLVSLGASIITIVACLYINGRKIWKKRLKFQE